MHAKVLDEPLLGLCIAGQLPSLAGQTQVKKLQKQGWWFYWILKLRHQNTTIWLGLQRRVQGHKFDIVCYTVNPTQFL